MTSEEQARKKIDALLLAAGWHICDVSDANIHAAKGVAIREFPLDAGLLSGKSSSGRLRGIGSMRWFVFITLCSPKVYINIDY